MAVGVQEDTVVCGIPTPMRPPDHVMVVPSCKSGDLLAAYRTETVLLFPQVQQLPSAFEGVSHLHAEAFFEVHFPVGIIRVGCPFDLDMPLNGHVPCTQERECMGWPLLTRVCPHKGPLSSLARAKGFLRHLPARLLRVPPCGPRPQTLEDGCIHFVEGDLTHHVAVIMRPSTKHWVELGAEMASRGWRVRLPFLRGRHVRRPRAPYRVLSASGRTGPDSASTS